MILLNQENPVPNYQPLVFICPFPIFDERVVYLFPTQVARVLDGELATFLPEKVNLPKITIEPTFMMDTETLELVTDGSGVNVFDYFVQNVTPENIGMTALNQKFYDYMKIKIETFCIVNGYIDGVRVDV